MSYVIHDCPQGSDEWHTHRQKHFNASEAPAMLGISPYQTRSELLRHKATGWTPEVSGAQQERFDNGHQFEAMARPWAEALLDSDLFPIVASTTDFDGIPLSASYDGTTMVEDVFEHKTLNQEIAASLDNGEIPLPYRVQMEQQLMINGGARALFMASNGDEKTMRHEWYYPDLTLRAQIIAGWKQFRVDLDAYQHVEESVKPAGKVIKALPSLSVTIVGEVKHSNLVAYRSEALRFIDKINTTLETDQHFADAEADVKFCEEAETKIAAVKEQIQGQASSIDEVFRTLDVIAETFRQKRLTLEKSVKSRKDVIRDEIRGEGVSAYAAFIAALNARLGRSYMPDLPVNFAGVMKGLRTITSLRDAVSTELARAKIAANAEADKIDANLKTLREKAADYAFLFADTPTIVLKAPDDLTMLVESRIAKHKQAEEERLAKERERIRLDEEAKARQRVAQEQERADREARAKLIEEETAAKMVEAERQRLAQQQPAPAPVEAQRPAANVNMSGDSLLEVFHEELDLLVKKFGDTTLPAPARALIATIKAYRIARKRQAA